MGVDAMAMAKGFMGGQAMGGGGDMLGGGGMLGGMMGGGAKPAPVAPAAPSVSGGGNPSETYNELAKLSAQLAASDRGAASGAAAYQASQLQPGTQYGQSLPMQPSPIYAGPGGGALGQSNINSYQQLQRMQGQSPSYDQSPIPMVRY
jgi:hypothetical protein